jgi:DNA repair protein RecN (Recombination protein N)
VCITHLPQIAAFADQHFLIEKADKRWTYTHQLCGAWMKAERTQEIARMLSGAKLTGEQPGACSAAC